MRRAARTSLAERLGSILDVAAFVALSATLFAAPLLHGALDDVPRFWLRCGAFGSLTLALLAVATQPRLWRASWPAATALLAFLAAVWLAAANRPYTYGGVQAALDLTVLAAAFVTAAAVVRTPARRATVLTGLLIGMAAVAVGGGLQALGHDLTPPLEDGRVSAWFRNPNHFAGLLDLAAPLALGTALFARSPWARAGGLVLAPVFYLVLGTTFSYGGWLATGLATLGLLVGWVVRGVRRRRAALPLASAVVVLMVGVLGLGLFLRESPRLRGTLEERIQTVIDVGAISSFRSRNAIQEAAWEMALDHPWLGVGPGAFPTRIVAYRPASATGPSGGVLHTTVLHPLNDYLNVATSAGLPSLAAFAAFWILALVRARNHPSSATPAVLAALAAILLHGLVDGNLTYVTGNGVVAFALVGLLQPRADARERSAA